MIGDSYKFTNVDLSKSRLMMAHYYILGQWRCIYLRRWAAVRTVT